MSSGAAASERAEAPAEERRPWLRGLLWLLFLVPVFFVTYNYANWLASRRDDVGAVVFAWEHHIPFWAWTIVPYWSIDFFYGLSLFVPRTRAELDGHARRLLAAQAISVTFFILLPLRFTFERPETHGLFGRLFAILGDFDRPFNQAPSLHISLLVILWALFARHARGLWRWPLHVLSISIGVSVLTTYQHHFIDIPTGVAAGGFCVLLIGLDGKTPTKQRDPRRWALGASYLATALAFGALGQWRGGAALWLWWPAASLAAVALAYFLGRADLFRKRSGRMDPVLVILLLPYLIAAWINSRWWTRRHPAASEVIPGLLLSRAPSAGELDRYRPAALVDCCAELPLRAGGRPTYPIPVLDLLVPEVEQIERGVEAISLARGAGKVLVFCALGVSRSATMVVAWLVAEGGFGGLSAAVERVRETRPGTVLSAGHLARLEEWQRGRSS